MFNALRNVLTRWFGPSATADTSASAQPADEHVVLHAEADDEANNTLVPYDENLLERARTQWQFGDWESLAALERDQLQHHPDRGKLALLAAAGLLQTGDNNKARDYIRLAQDWGVSDKMISRILIAGVHNSLGRASAASGQDHRALNHFENAVATGTPGGEVRLLSQARMNYQLSQGNTRHDVFLNATTPRNVNSQDKRPISDKQVENNKSGAADNNDNIKPKFGSDAQIDDFINDIAPFFAGRAITYVDVGAYIGEVLLKILDTRKINIREAHLIEPNPESFTKLKENVQDCNVPSCNVYNFGISNQVGIATFRAAKSMTKKLNADIPISNASNLFEVECQRLDDISSVFTDGHVDLLKLDVEGEELDVLQSAKALFERQRVDVLYVEVGLNREGTQQTYFGVLDSILQSHGYRVFKIYEQKNEWIEDSPLLRRCNAAYMSHKFVSMNPNFSKMKTSRNAS